MSGLHHKFSAYFEGGRQENCAAKKRGVTGMESGSWARYAHHSRRWQQHHLPTGAPTHCRIGTRALLLYCTDPEKNTSCLSTYRISTQFARTGWLSVEISIQCHDIHYTTTPQTTDSRNFSVCQHATSRTSQSFEKHARAHAKLQKNTAESTHAVTALRREKR